MLSKAKKLLDRVFNREVDAILRHRKGGDFKQAIVIRTDLEMGKGKLVAQGSHASLHAFQKCVEVDERMAYAWDQAGCKKIVLKAGSEGELLKLYDKAKKKGLPAVIIRDAGATQIPSGTVTALGIGPWLETDIDAVTGELKLL